MDAIVDKSFDLVGRWPVALQATVGLVALVCGLAVVWGAVYSALALVAQVAQVPIAVFHGWPPGPHNADPAAHAASVRIAEAKADG